MERSRRISRRLARQCIVALLLIASLTFLEYLSSSRALFSQRDMSAVINLSGRQRMLVESIRYKILRKAIAPAFEDNEINSQLIEAATQLEDVHNSLVHGNPDLGFSPSLPEQAKVVYFGAAIDLDRKLNEFLKFVRSQAATVSDAPLTNEQIKELDSWARDVLSGLEQATLARQKHASEQVENLRRLQLMMLLLNFGVAIGIYFFIFRPMIEEVKFQTLNLEATNTKLAEEVERRIRTEADLRASSKLAALGEMAGSIAHEVNNPLAVIQGRAELLALAIDHGTFKTESARPVIETIVATSERLAKIINGLHFIADTGPEESFGTASVGEVVGKALEVCSERFARHHVEIRVSSPANGLDVECRRAQLTQVLVHLLNNAVDAVSQLDDKWINVNVARENSAVTISVTDSGRGIPFGIRERLMEPFFTTKPMGKGSGLGLSVSKTILEDHHGALTCDFNSPHTRFVMKIPVQQPLPEAAV